MRVKEYLFIYLFVPVVVFFEFKRIQDGGRFCCFLSFRYINCLVVDVVSLFGDTHL